MSKGRFSSLKDTDLVARFLPRRMGDIPFSLIAIAGVAGGLAWLEHGSIGTAVLVGLFEIIQSGYSRKLAAERRAGGQH